MKSSFDAARRLVSQIDSTGQVTNFAYDNVGNKTAITDSLGQVVRFTYDAIGNQVTETDAKNQVTTFAYNGEHRLTRILFPDGTEKRTSYDALGRITTETDQAGKSTQFGYDALGRLTSVTDALGQITRYTYDEAGNRVTQTDVKGHVTRFEFDRLGRQTRRILPGGAAESATYDAEGNQLMRTDFAGRTTTYTSDTSNRVTRRIYPDGSVVTFAYTPTGQPTTVTDARGTTTYSYDTQGRVQSVGYPNGQSLSYAYDTRGNRIGLTATVGASTLTTSYAYDALNRLQTVTDPMSRVYTSTYDPNGNRSTLAYPNGVTTSATYDSVNRLTGLTTARTPSGQTIQSYAYTVGPAGQRTRITEHGGTVKDYSYDALYRLTNERVNTGGTLTSEDGFSYDPVGNRTTRTGVGGNTTVTYTYDERDRLLSANTTTSTWDAQGNLQSTTGEATYTWDVENRLIRVAPVSGPVVTHVYDVDSNRVQTTVTPQTGTPVVTNYLVDTSEELSHVVAESDNTSTLKAYYVRGEDELLAVMRSGSTRFIHADGLGSVRALTDETGNITDTYTYSAFGELLSHAGSDPQPYAFAGEPREINSGLSYHRARWMDPRVGRFVSLDSFPGLREKPISLHKYLYGHADPVNTIDPTGLKGDLSEWISTISLATSLVWLLLLPLIVSGDNKPERASIRIQVQIGTGKDSHIASQSMDGISPPGITVAEFENAAQILYLRAVDLLPSKGGFRSGEIRKTFHRALLVKTVAWARRQPPTGVRNQGRPTVYQAFFPNESKGSEELGPYRVDTEVQTGHNLMR